MERKVSVWDILDLSVGLKFQIMQYIVGKIYFGS